MTKRNSLLVELSLRKLKMLAVKVSPSRRLSFHGIIRTKQEKESVS